MKPAFTTKNYKSYLVALALAFSIVPFAYSFAAPDVGFPSRPVWFSKESFVADETISIYTLLLNTSDATFSGTVEFLNATTTIGSTPFSITPDERSKIVSVAWKVTPGDHTISARITNARLATATGAQTVAPTGAATEVRTFAVAAPIVITPPVSEEVATTTRTQAIDKYVPEVVRTAAAPVENALEQARVAGANAIASFTQDNRTRINELRGKTPPAATTTSATASSTTPETTTSAKKSVFPPRVETPFRYVYWGLLTLVGYVFTLKTLYYSIVVVVVWMVVRGIVRTIRRRRAI